MIILDYGGRGGVTEMIILDYGGGGGGVTEMIILDYGWGRGEVKDYQGGKVN